MSLEQLMIHNNNKRFHSNRTIAKGHISKMRCNFCGRNITSEDEEYEDDSKGLNYEILQACRNNFSDTVNTIE